VWTGLLRSFAVTRPVLTGLDRLNHNIYILHNVITWDVSSGGGAKNAPPSRVSNEGGCGSKGGW
jgi:hypothetical protein